MKQMISWCVVLMLARSALGLELQIGDLSVYRTQKPVQLVAPLLFDGDGDVAALNTTLHYDSSVLNPLTPQATITGPAAPAAVTAGCMVVNAVDQVAPSSTPGIVP